GLRGGGGVGPTRGGGLRGRPGADAAAEVLQPSGSPVCDAGSVGREPGPVHGSGGVGAGHRCVQRGGTSLTLVGQPPSRHGSDTSCTVPSQPVASHCSRFRGETPFGASPSGKMLRPETW